MPAAHGVPLDGVLVHRRTVAKEMGLRRLTIHRTRRFLAIFLTSKRDSDNSRTTARARAVCRIAMQMKLKAWSEVAASHAAGVPSLPITRPPTRGAWILCKRKSRLIWQASFSCVSLSAPSPAVTEDFSHTRAPRFWRSRRVPFRVPHEVEDTLGLASRRQRD